LSIVVDANTWSAVFGENPKNAFRPVREWVDEREAVVIELTSGTDCNDQHAIALIGVSGCRLYCSLDTSSFRHLKDRRYYPKGCKPPRIYSGARNKKLLCPANAVPLRNIAYRRA
jgi:hypothetical protein